MNELDDRLAVALQRRADLAEGLVVAPLEVRREVRRQRLQTWRLTAAAAVLVALPVTGFAAGQRDQSSSHHAVQSAEPLPAGVVAAVPWSGNVDLTLHKGDPDGSSQGWSYCFGAQCSPLAAAGRDSISLPEGATTVQGLAPTGTTRVVVTVDDAAAVEAHVSAPVATSAAGSPGVLFGAPDAVISRPEGSAFSLSYLITAYDAGGRQLATRQSLGGWDLAQQHPLSGPVATVVDGGPTDPSVVAWADADGWVCWGEQATATAGSGLGAYACIPPVNAGSLALLTEDVSNELTLLRVPANVAQLAFRDASGRVVLNATIRDVGHDRIAVIDGRATGWPPGFTVTGVDRAGSVVVRTPARDLQPVNGTVTSD